MDMSKWDADQPGTTEAWWKGRSAHVPFTATEQFNSFLEALGAYNLSPTAGTLWNLQNAATALVRALKNEKVRTKDFRRNQIASFTIQILGRVELQPLRSVGSSHASTAGANENLIHGIRNLLATFGTTVIPDQYYDW